MEKLLAAAFGASILFVAPALASDPIAPEPLAADAVPFTWSGGYVGVRGGGGSTTARSDRGTVNGDLLNLDVENGLFLDTMEDRDNDLVGGLRGGFDRQVGMFVFGARAGVQVGSNGSFASHSAIDPNCSSPLFCGLETRTETSTNIRYLLDAQIVGGVAMGRTRVYGAAGFARGRVRNELGLDLIARQPGNLSYAKTFSTEEWLNGYTLSAGVEHAVTDNLSVMLEYGFYDFEDTSVRAIDPLNFGDNSIDYEFENQGHSVMAGVNYRF